MLASLYIYIFYMGESLYFTGDCYCCFRSLLMSYSSGLLYILLLILYPPWEFSWKSSEWILYKNSIWGKEQIIMLFFQYNTAMLRVPPI